MTQEFEVGNRVRVKPEEAQYFLVPWRDRFARGITGVIKQARANRWGDFEYFVQFEPRRKPKRPADWGMWLPARDLELAEVTHDQND